MGKLLYTTGLPWQVVVTCRAMIPAILILCYNLLRNREVFSIQKKHLPLFLLNALFFGFISICNYCALYYIDAAVATVLLYTLPVFTVIFSRIVLKEPLTSVKFVAMTLTFVGVIFIIQITNINNISAGTPHQIFGISSTLLGIIVGLLSGLLSALYTICTKKLNNHYPAWTVNSWCYFLSFPIFFLVGAPKIIAFEWTFFHFGAIFIMALIGVSAYSLYAISMQYMEAGKASLLVTLDPVFSVTMCIFILGEELTVLQILGCALVLLGVLTMEKGNDIKNHFRGKNKGAKLRI